VEVTFWGVRGSVPAPGPETNRYGGNTSCVSVRTAGGHLIVIDMGTGAINLGRTLMAAEFGKGKGHATVLLSHAHWDHIQGFPFFAPLFVPGSEWDVYAPRQMGRTLAEILGGQMHRTYFPVPLGELAATIRYHELTEGVFDLDAVRVTTRYLNHPAPALGYRLEANGVAVVYATDHEPHSRHHPDVRGDAARVHREDARHIEFLAGADLVIHDATYTLAEYPAKVSWGHSPAEWAVDFAVAAHARRLALFHNDPSRTDRAIDELLTLCRQRLPTAGASDVFAAAEGQYLVVVRPGVSPVAAGPVVATTAERVLPEYKTTVLVADDDDDVMAVIVETLEPEGYRVLTASDGEAALQIARDERPDIVVLDWMMPKRDGLSVCRELRKDADPKVALVPVVLITGRTDAQDTVAGFDAGVTDYLTKPFKPTYLVARLQSWLIRSQRS
jgi:CheY-like chemotaxis protein/phosphoribosyl 1,2-cyclic phosphodiesterase